MAFVVALSITDTFDAQATMTKSSQRTPRPRSKAARKRQSAKIGKVMHEYKTGALHSGSKSGPIVHSRDQAIAIALHKAAARRK